MTDRSHLRLVQPPAPIITIGQRVTDDRYYVEVTPDQLMPTCEFATHREAFGFAAGIRMIHRWRIIDTTEAGADF